MTAFLNALREEGTRQEILDALAEKITERDALVDQVTKLREVLKPFATYGDKLIGIPDTAHITYEIVATLPEITVKDCMRARAVYTVTEPKEVVT